MKKLVVLVFALFLISAAAVAQSPTANGVASVYVTVTPTVSVTAPGTLDLGSITTGNFSASLVWVVGANQQFVRFFIEASDLYKADNPADTTVSPILLNTSSRAVLTAQFGNETNAGDNKAGWLTHGGGAAVGAYPTTATEIVTYESSQNGHFSQNVTTQIFYTQPDAEQPTGQYSGKVRFTVLL